MKQKYGKIIVQNLNRANVTAYVPRIILFVVSHNKIALLTSNNTTMTLITITVFSLQVTLKEMEDHKVMTHPNVWCSHFEFSGDQRELYKHLFLPGKDVPTTKARTAVLVEKVCTKCSKNCTTLPELHRHMLECGGDQAWLLGLFGNGKKKCKWRPFGSRSRRRRQRGMKRNIQNSQTPRVNTPKEKQPTGPRVRPSDSE